MENRRKEHLYPVSPGTLQEHGLPSREELEEIALRLDVLNQKAREGIKILKRARGVNSLNDLPLNLRRQLDELIE